MRATIILLILIVCCSSGVMSQSQTTADSLAAMYIDFSPPDLSAFTLLGVNSNSVARPGNLKELSVAFLNAASMNGKITPGIAIEWSPFHTFGSSSLARYKESIFLRRLQLSFATSQDSGTSSVAIGVRCIPIDDSDPLDDPELNNEVNKGLAYFDQSNFAAAKRKAYQDQVNSFCKRIEPDVMKAFEMDSVLAPETLLNSGKSVDSVVNEIVAVRKTQSGPPLTSEEIQKLRELAAIGLSFRGTSDVTGVVDRLIEQAKNKFKNRYWNATVVQLAVGNIWNSPTSSWSALHPDRWSAFGGGTFRVGTFGQLIAQAQYTGWYGEKVNEQSKLSVGTRFLAGSSSFHGTIEALYACTKRNNPQPDDQTLRYTVGLETKLSEGLWLEIGMGAVAPQGGGIKLGMISLANLKYALGKKAIFNIQ